MRRLLYESLNCGAGGWTTKHVLVVDDSPVTRKFLARHLQRMGFLIDEAKDGVDALEKMKEKYACMKKYFAFLSLLENY